jgi:RIO kinase 1
VITNDYDHAHQDKYEHYEELFNPLNIDRQARRKRKPKVKHIPKKSPGQVITEIAETVGLEGGFQTTYQPARYEEGWLLDSLRSFYDQALISDVLAQVKGGKEASVYCCEADPVTGETLLAAKVYRPRQFRNLRNDAMYRQGRTTLKANGRSVKKNDHRIMRAIGKKTAFGVQAQHTSWLMYEYTTLERLYRVGAAVPQPIASSENAILMSYIGDAQMAAPILNEVSLASDEAESLFQEVRRNIELMLQYDLIHGDLSAYNILYWQGKITLIDFPQVVNGRTNRKAHFILKRDIQRICEYFIRQGVRCNPSAMMNELWTRYLAIDPKDQAADESRFDQEDDDFVPEEFEQ